MDQPDSPGAVNAPSPADNIIPSTTPAPSTPDAARTPQGKSPRAKTPKPKRASGKSSGEGGHQVFLRTDQLSPQASKSFLRAAKRNGNSLNREAVHQLERINTQEEVSALADLVDSIRIISEETLAEVRDVRNLADEMRAIVASEEAAREADRRTFQKQLNEGVQVFLHALQEQTQQQTQRAHARLISTMMEMSAKLDAFTARQGSSFQQDSQQHQAILDRLDQTTHEITKEVAELAVRVEESLDAAEHLQTDVATNGTTAARLHESVAQGFHRVGQSLKGIETTLQIRSQNPARPASRDRPSTGNV